MQGEWKYIGLVIDRLLLITYLLITIFGTILIIFNAPHIFQFVDQQETKNHIYLQIYIIITTIMAYFYFIY